MYLISSVISILIDFEVHRAQQ